MSPYLQSHVTNALLNAWGFILYLAPYLVSGVLLAALVNTFVSRRKLARLVTVRRWWLLPVSAIAGLVSPACTYGTVPVFMEMIKSGAPTAPAATFLVASALVNPQMFLLTGGALGWPIAIIQAAASMAFAILVGMLVSHLAARGVDLEGSEIKAARKAEASQEAPTEKDLCSLKHAPWPRRLGVNMLNLTEFVGFYFVIGTLIATLVAEFIPAGLIIAAVGQGKWWAIPFAAVVSIPTYVCGGGTIPFIAQAKSMGMASGAVLAFLIAGPATRITALSALAVLFRKRAVAIYAILLLCFATLLGALIGGQIATQAPPAF